MSFWHKRAVMNNESFLQRLFAAGNSYWLTRFVILRLLGFVYAVAFLIAAQQLVPLIGEHGLTPADHFLESVQTQLGSRTAGLLRVPTLFGSEFPMVRCRSSPGSALACRWLFLAATPTQFCSRCFGRCTCRSCTLDRFGTVTVGRFNCWRPAFCRFFFV